jgi:hypothetical protein
MYRLLCFHVNDVFVVAVSLHRATSTPIPAARQLLSFFRASYTGMMGRKRTWWTFCWYTVAGDQLSLPSSLLCPQRFA